MHTPEPDNHDFGLIDIVAFIIAAFQLLLPVLVGLVGVVLLIYLVLRFMARA